MSQENVGSSGGFGLHMFEDYEASIAALDGAVELWSDPHEPTWRLGSFADGERCLPSIGGFILSFDDYWCEEPEGEFDRRRGLGG